MLKGGGEGPSPPLYAYVPTTNIIAKICKDFILNNDTFINEAMNIIYDVINENNSIVNPLTNSNKFFNKRLYQKLTIFSDWEFGELTVFSLIIQKVKQGHDKFEKQNKKKQQEKLNNIYKSIAFLKKHSKCLSTCSVFCTFPNALECLNDKKTRVEKLLWW